MTISPRPGEELALLRNAAISGTRLRVVPELQSQSGDVWFRKRQAVAGGFETTFGLSLNQTNPNPLYLAADGLAFVVQNSDAGSGAQSPQGEDGLPAKALNIKFDTFGTVDDASALEVRANGQVLQRVVLFQEPGVDLHGLFPGQETFNYTTATQAASPPYQVRIVYVPGSLDVYFDGVAVVQNLAVDLDQIGAMDGNGTAFAGFTSRTGGNIQNSDLTSWHFRSGDFSELPPFGLVKSSLKPAGPGLAPSSLVMVWNSEEGRAYKVRWSPDLNEWQDLSGVEYGIPGQLKLKLDLPEPAERRYFRVEETAP